MAVYKVLTCQHTNRKGNRCFGSVYLSKVNMAQLPKCPKCGASMRVPAKWTVYVNDGAIDPTTGKRKAYSKAYSVDKKEAKAHEHDIIEMRDKGDVVPRGKKLSYGRILEAFLDQLTKDVRDNIVAEGTKGAYERIGNGHFAEFFKGKDMLKVSKKILAEYKDFRYAMFPEIKPNTINGEMAKLHKFLQFAKNENLINVTIDDPERVGGARKKERTLRIKELRKLGPLLTDPSIPEEARLWAIIGLNSGLRRDALLTLKWEEIVEWESKEHGPAIYKKVKHRRRALVPNEAFIPLTQATPLPIPPLLPTLLELKQRRFGKGKAKGFVVVNPRTGGGHTTDTIRVGLDMLYDAAGINTPDTPADERATVHTLRDTFASFIDALTTDLRAIQIILGHTAKGEKGQGMTSAYCKFHFEKAYAAIRAFEKRAPLDDTFNVSIRRGLADE